jgi:hypothetical protein
LDQVEAFGNVGVAWIGEGRECVDGVEVRLGEADTLDALRSL